VAGESFLGSDVGWDYVHVHVHDYDYDYDCQ
jgi:hypothetical protein